MPTADVFLGNFPCFSTFFATRVKPQRTAPKVYMEKLQKLLVHAAKHGPLEPAEWNFWMGSFSTTESFAANNWGRYIYIHTILYIYYVIMYYICMYIYDYIYNTCTYLHTYLPTYVNRMCIYIYTHTHTNYINTYIHIIHINIYIYTDTLYNLSG